MPPKELKEAYSNHTVRPSRLVSGAYLLYSSRQESQIWFVDASWDGGVLCTIFWSLTLTSDLVFRIFVFGAYPILFEVGIPNWYVHACVGYHPWVTVTLTSDLVSRIVIESGAYLLYSLR